MTWTAIDDLVDTRPGLSLSMPHRVG